MSKIVQRILSKIGIGDLLTKLNELPPSELTSLRLGLYKKQIEKITPATLLKNYRNNRFVTPSMVDPVEYRKLEIKLMQEAKGLGIIPILLSPVAPIGNCACLADVNQNNVLSSIRGVEVLADSTNMMALYLADKLKSGELNNQADVIHLCSCDRLTRAQLFDKPGFFAHFGIFAMISSGRDGGSYVRELSLLATQLHFYMTFLQNYCHSELKVILRKRMGYSDIDGFFQKMCDELMSEFSSVAFEIDSSDVENPYYLGINFKIFANTSQMVFELGDGGFVDWTQKLLSNKKERLLISAISLDRLLLFLREGK